MLLDHALVPVQTRHAWIVWLRIGLTRPALPLFMVVSGTLLGERGANGIKRQVVRIAPWVVAATLAAAYVPGFGWPEPLTSYLAALPLVWCAMRYGPTWVWAGGMMLVALAVPWPFLGYNPAELAGWILFGVLAWRYCGDWSSTLPAPKLLRWVGRRSLWFYTGELIAIAAICVGVGAR